MMHARVSTASTFCGVRVSDITFWVHGGPQGGQGVHWRANSERIQTQHVRISLGAPMAGSQVCGKGETGLLKRCLSASATMGKERRSKTGARLSRQPDVMQDCNLAQCEHACRRTGHARDMSVMHRGGAGGPLRRLFASFMVFIRV